MSTACQLSSAQIGRLSTGASMHLSKWSGPKAPERIGVIPCIGDIILYNVRIPAMDKRRQSRERQKRGCMVVTSITNSLVFGYSIKNNGSSLLPIRFSMSLSISDFVYGNILYVKLNEAIDTNEFPYAALELTDAQCMQEKICYLDDGIKQIVVR